MRLLLSLVTDAVDRVRNNISAQRWRFRLVKFVVSGQIGLVGSAFGNVTARSTIKMGRKGWISVPF
jgi:hypothetical protein